MMEWSGSLIGLVGSVVSGGALGVILTYMSLSRKHRRDDFTVMIETLRSDNDDLRKRLREAEQAIIELHKERAGLLERMAKMDARILMFDAKK